LSRSTGRGFRKKGENEREGGYPRKRKLKKHPNTIKRGGRSV